MRIIKHCNVSDLPEGSLFRQLKTNNIYIRVGIDYENQGIDISCICLDSNDVISNFNFSTDIELLREGYTSNLYRPVGTIKVCIDYRVCGKLEAVKFVKHALNLGLKEAKDLLDERIALGENTVIIDMLEDKYYELISVSGYTQKAIKII